MNRTVPLFTGFGASGDPETSSDPRIRALVSDLARLDYAPAPRPEFRAELRAQLVAIAGRVVLEGEPDGSAPASIDPTEAALAARTATITTLRPSDARKRRSFGRPLGLAAACCAVLALGLGGAVWKSRSALPGDSLYGLKRESESVQLSLASGGTDRGHEYLKLASVRVQEARDLLGRDSAMASGGGVQAGGVSPSTVALIQSTLRSANGDVRSGSSLLGTAAEQSHSSSPLTIMTTWAPSQLQQLHQLADALGNGPAHASTLRSWTLVNSALHRARVLGPQVASHCAASVPDSLGPVGCANAAQHGSNTPPRGAQHASSHPTRTRSQHARTHVRTTAHGKTAHGGSTTPQRSKHPTDSRTSSHPTTSAPGILPASLPNAVPTLPTSLPSVPVSVQSCGVSAQIGPIGVHLGSCPTHS